MMDGYWIMFGSGIMLGVLFYMCLDLAGSIFLYLKLKRKELAEKSSLPEGGK